MDTPPSSQGFLDPASHLFEYLERTSWLLGGREGWTVETLQAKDEAIAAREKQSAGVALPLLGLRARGKLDLASLHILVLAAVASLDATLGARLAERIGGATPTVQDLVALLAWSSGDDHVLLDKFAADAPLRMLELIELGGDGRTPLLRRTVHVDERIAMFLRGHVDLDPNLREVAVLHRTAPPAEPTATRVLQDLLAAGQPGPIVVEGPARVGKVSAIVAAVVGRGDRALVADLERITDGAGASLTRLYREALLLDARLVLRIGESQSRWTPELTRQVGSFAQRGIAIVATRAGDAIVRGLLGARRVKVAMPSRDDQRRLWVTELGASDHAIDDVVARYPLPPGDIIAAAATARAHAQVAGRACTVADLVVAARERLSHRLGDVAQLVETSLSWDDLVLREEVVTRILEIVSAVRLHDQVMGRWGFANKLPYGRSVSALFSGEPGTGKTMVGTLIGKELGFEVFRVDLSRVVSKYIGETEQNLARVFDEARRCRAILLFDEADSLFSKRTEVKSSNDRYANLEVNFLLQRLEAHDGIVILTTNAATSIDPAFMRRIRYRIEFPAPDDAERAQLWRSMIPGAAPLAKDVDLSTLGRTYRLTGGHIKNAVVRAAFLAAAEALPAISHDVLARAAHLEWTELGNL